MSLRDDLRREQQRQYQKGAEAFERQQNRQHLAHIDSINRQNQFIQDFYRTNAEAQTPGAGSSSSGFWKMAKLVGLAVLGVAGVATAVLTKKENSIDFEPVQIKCERCGQQLRLPTRRNGHWRCPKCKEPV
jgi:hypothetical protein